MCVYFWKMFGTKASGSSVGYKKRSIPMANTSKKRKQPSKWQQDVQNQVLSEAWAKLSPAQCKERWWRRNKEDLREGVHGGEGEGVWWVQVRRGKNPRQGESLDEDKTDSSTTNKQDPQDTPVGRRISWQFPICRTLAQNVPVSTHGHCNQLMFDIFWHFLTMVDLIGWEIIAPLFWGSETGMPRKARCRAQYRCVLYQVCIRIWGMVMVGNHELDGLWFMMV